MNSFALLIGLVCVCSIAVSILGTISPNGMTEKTLGLVTGVFIICVMLVPVKNFFTDFNVNINLPKTAQSISSDAQSAYNVAVIKECKARLEQSLLSVLKNSGYEVKDADIKLSEKPDGGIYISGISIYIDKGESRVNKIIRRTEEEFKVTPEVIARQ